MRPLSTDVKGPHPRSARPPSAALAAEYEADVLSIQLDRPVNAVTQSRRHFVASFAASAAGAPLVSRAWVTDPAALIDLPILSNEQLGHLRHIERLAALPDGEWAMMGALDPGQEDLTAYRYQIAHMAYAVGLAHYHRLPAAAGVLRPTFAALIHKMLRREVWSYWRETSRSGSRVDPGLTTLREGWTDPVKLENIMYSGHLHAMVGMYATLFDDDRYAEPGALTFKYDPIFYGLGPESYRYDHASLTKVIFDQMKASGWLGVPCEPNNVFIICNQYPILGFRWFDLRRGTDLVAEAVAGYRSAWERKGMLDPFGNNISTWMVRQDHKVDAFSGGFSAWAGAAMNAWNRDEVRSRYPGILAQWTERLPDGRVTLRSPQAVIAARKGVAAAADHLYPWSSPDFGYFAMWISEMGDEDTLRGLLRHADRFMNPTWQGGALYYPRQDRPYDDAGNLTFMDPVTGNAMLGYARLNVPDGLWSLYQKPWTKRHFAEPAIAEISADLGLLGARYDGSREVLALAVQSRHGRTANGTVAVANLPRERAWTLRRGGRVVATSQAPGSFARWQQDRLVLGLEVERSSRFDLALTS